jgi:hypothetical protein
MLAGGFRRRQRDAFPDPEWLNSFTISRYSPMRRLLTDEDERYLCDAGVDRGALKRLRRQRRRVFRTYLTNLTRDFHRLHGAARLLVLHADTDCSDIAEQLVRARLVFGWALFLVECRLALHSLGIGTVDVGRLIGAANDVASGIHLLTPVRSAAGISV